MSRHRQFLVQLENFDHESTAVAQYIYADMAVNHAASTSKTLLRRLNDTPGFWIASRAAFQAAAYIALGRVFDTKSPYNVNALLDTMESDLSLFQRAALADRKRRGQSTDPEWLSGYLDRAYYPTIKDVALLRSKVATYREIYDRAIKPARHKAIAHREKQERAEVQALYARGTVRELWRLTIFLIQLNDILWNLLHNGTRPSFRSRPYSIKAIYASKTGSNSVAELMVADVKKLMLRLERSDA